MWWQWHGCALWPLVVTTAQMWKHAVISLREQDTFVIHVSRPQTMPVISPGSDLVWLLVLGESTCLDSISWILADCVWASPPPWWHQLSLGYLCWVSPLHDGISCVIILPVKSDTDPPHCRAEQVSGTSNGYSSTLYESSTYGEPEKN